MKEVIANTANKQVEVRSCEKNRIYAWVSQNDIYKLHKVDDNNYAFIDMSNSECWANRNGGFYEMLNRAIGEGDTVYEFYTTQEFAEWMLKEFRKLK